MKMRRMIMFIISIFLIVAMVACQPQEQPAPPQQNENPEDVAEEHPNEQHEINEDLRDRMRIVEEATVPESVREWFEEFGNEEGAYIHQHPDATYIKINAGERPTGGYGIRVVDYDEDEYPRVIYIEYMVPGDEDVVTQAIAYPTVILQIDTDMAAAYEVRTTEGENLPTESTLVFAKLELPEENQEIGNPVEVRGKIIAFEGAFVVRIIDNEDKLIHEEHLQADAGGPSWGNFNEEIRYPVPEAEEGRLEVGEYSAKDGEYIMREQVSVRFKNTSE